jgi:hypothetical protein
MSINYKEKYLKYKEKYLELKNQLGGQPEMSKEEFRKLMTKAHHGNTTEVLAAVDQDRRLVTRTNNSGFTLLINACHNGIDNPELAQGLLERGANVNARTSSADYDALMYTAFYGLISACKVLLDHGANPDSHNQHTSALCVAARQDRLQMCLLLISYRANLMLIVDGNTALDEYDKFSLPRYTPRLTPVELSERRAILLTAFEQGPHPDMCWKRRWPMMSVMAGCGFRPLVTTIANSQTLSPTPKGFRQRFTELFANSKASPPHIQIVLTSLPRAYYMQIIFRSDRLLRMIVSFL